MVAGRAMKRALLHIALLPLAMFVTVAVAEDELPRELLLRCELKNTTFIVSGGKTDFHDDTEVKDFHLKDGIFEFTSGYVPLGTSCRLIDGKIGCKFSKTSARKSGQVGSVQLGPSVEKRESRVLLTRATGEIHVFIQTQTYDGESIKGTPSFTMTWNMEGVCRTIGKPLF
jgi:hypothetical protein